MQQGSVNVVCPFIRHDQSLTPGRNRMKGYSNVVEAVVLSTLSGNCGESAHNADILSPGCGLGQVQR